jgi:hypothetical protein
MEATKKSGGADSLWKNEVAKLKNQMDYQILLAQQSI